MLNRETDYFSAALVFKLTRFLENEVFTSIVLAIWKVVKF